jgi:hypothetical protein
VSGRGIRTRSSIAANADAAGADPAGADEVSERDDEGEAHDVARASAPRTTLRASRVGEWLVRSIEALQG